MRPSPSLLRSLSLTLFTRHPCGLCDSAKHVLTTLRSKKTQPPFSYNEIDVMKPEHDKWRECYEFDVPVLHVDAEGQLETDKTRKLFHRFTEEEVLEAMRAAGEGK